MIQNNLLKQVLMELSQSFEPLNPSMLCTGDHMGPSNVRHGLDIPSHGPEKHLFIYPLVMTNIAMV